MSLDMQTVTAWMDELGKVWRKADIDGAAALMTEDAHYRNGPFNDRANVGSAEIRRFWEQALIGASDVRLRYGRPVIQEQRAAVEWWAHVRYDDVPQTLAGSIFLTFVGDQVSDLREYFTKSDGFLEPHDDWGM